MSYQPPQPPPAFGPVTPTQKRRSVNKVILSVIGGVAFLCCAGGIVAVAVAPDAKDPDAKDITATAAAPAGTTGAQDAVAPLQATTEPAEDYVPTAKDFTLKVKILDKQCFGSAGCNVEYRVVPAYSGRTFSSGKEVEVTYEVRGLEDTATATFTMDGSGSATLSEESGSTTSADKKLTAQIVDVEMY